MDQLFLERHLNRHLLRNRLPYGISKFFKICFHFNIILSDTTKRIDF